MSSLLQNVHTIQNVSTFCNSSHFPKCPRFPKTVLNVFTLTNVLKWPHFPKCPHFSQMSSCFRMFLLSKKMSLTIQNVYMSTMLSPSRSKAPSGPHKDRTTIPHTHTHTQSYWANTLSDVWARQNQPAKK